MKKSFLQKKIRSSLYVPLRITLIYLILGGLWILFSEKITASFTNDIDLLTTIQMYKGWFFILITAIFFYVFIKRDFILIEKTQRELSESERLFRSLFENAPLGYQAIDKSGIIIAINKAACHMLDYDEQELIGKKFSDLIIEENGENFSKIFSHIEIAGQLHSAEYQIRKKENDIKIVSLEGKVTYTAEGKFKLLHCILTDITERKKIEADLRKLSSAVDQSPVAVSIINRSGNIEYVNPRFTQLTGFSLNDFAGRFHSLLKPSSMENDEYEKVWSGLSHGKEWSGEIINTKKNGETYWELLSVSPIKNNDKEITHYLVLKEDITSRKMIEKELIRAKEEAEDLSRLKSNLLGNISHELRTPLVGIIGFAEFLGDTELDVEQQDMVQKIINSSKRLTNTLNSILYLSQFAARENYLNFEEINIAKHTPFHLHPFIEAAKEKGLEFSVVIKSPSVSAMVDDKMYFMILNNLVDNAIKFTKQGKVEIIVEPMVFNGNKYSAIHIRDTGIGIAENDKEKIFQEFRQASEGVARWYEGTGLGLTLAKKMVEAMNGTIQLKSEIGKGSTFTVMFPATDLKKQEDHELDISHISGSTKSKQILLVEDNIINREVTELYIKDYYKIDHAENGELAIEMSKQNNYDVILMDINLGGGINGIETAREIRKLNGYENIPLVAVTGYAMAGDKEVLLSEGLTHYLAKPFEKGELLRLLAEILDEN